MRGNDSFGESDPSRSGAPREATIAGPDRPRAPSKGIDPERDGFSGVRSAFERTLKIVAAKGHPLSRSYPSPHRVSKVNSLLCSEPM